MSWIPITVNKTECVGTSLTAFNDNFSGIATFLDSLSSEFYGSFLLKTNNLGDVGNAATARSELGLGSAATESSNGLAKAWVAFQGQFIAPYMTTEAGTMTRTGASSPRELTVTTTNPHNLAVNDFIYLRRDSGTLTWAAKTVQVKEVVSPTIFKANDTNFWTGINDSSSAVSGSATVNYHSFNIDGSFNIKKIVRLDDLNTIKTNFGVLFSTPRPSTTYAVVPTASVGGPTANLDNQQIAGISRKFTNGFVIGLAGSVNNTQSRYISAVVYG